MKVLIYIFYFLRSLALRGLGNTIKLLHGELVYEKKFGINTNAIKKSNSKEFFHYQGAAYFVLFEIFKEIAPKTNHFNFVDIGCGKGRPIFVAESFGYKNLIGLDLDEELITIARSNQKKCLLKNKLSHVAFVCINALQYDYTNLPTVYFMFNPFNKEILSEVLKRILSATKSETWFVYMNPLFADTFTTDKFELIKELKTKRYLEALIFRVKTA